MGEERRRSAARVEMLSAAIRGEDAETGDLRLKPDDTQAPDRFVFVDARPRARMALTLALGVFVVGSAAALAVVLTAGSRTAGSPPVVATPPSADVPVELLALGHERNGDTLTVRGVVRNPPAAATMSGLVAVVFVFNREGNFVASGRSPVAGTTLDPGAESAFVVSVPGMNDIGRYRVSFKTDDRVVAHVDQRARGRTSDEP
jgi:hypothetical protein